jgi:hypothetical protein
LLGVQEQAYEDAISATPPARDLVAYVVEVVVPAVVDASLAAGPAMLRDSVAQRLESTDPREFIAAWIEGHDQTTVDRFLARASVGPVLEALGPEAAARVQESATISIALSRQLGVRPHDMPRLRRRLELATPHLQRGRDRVR